MFGYGKRDRIGPRRDITRRGDIVAVTLKANPSRTIVAEVLSTDWGQLALGAEELRWTRNGNAWRPQLLKVPFGQVRGLRVLVKAGETEGVTL